MDSKPWTRLALHSYYKLSAHFKASSLDSTSKFNFPEKNENNGYYLDRANESI